MYVYIYSIYGEYIGIIFPYSLLRTRTLIHCDPCPGVELVCTENICACAYVK